jgi:hypothetical protein
MDHANDHTTDVVHVEDGRVCVQACGMELIGVLHRDAAKRFEITIQVRVFNFAQSGIHNSVSSEA